MKLKVLKIFKGGERKTGSVSGLRVAGRWSAAFLMMELVVVIAIIAILAAISVPRYRRYKAMAIRTEAATLLTAIKLAEESYWHEHGSYTQNLGKGGLDLDFVEDQPPMYTVGFSGEGSKGGVTYVVGRLGNSDDAIEYLRGTFAGRGGFLARAVAELPGGGIDVWEVTEKTKPRNVVNGMK